MLRAKAALKNMEGHATPDLWFAIAGNGLQLIMPEGAEIFRKNPRTDEPFGSRQGIKGMTEREITFECDLIRRVQAGEQQAFQQIAGQHSEQLFRCALMLCRDRQLAEDISQESLLEAWKSIGRFDGRCRFSTWLYGILRHRFLKARERTARRIEAESSSAESQSDSQTNSQSTSQVISQSLADPTQVLERAEDADRVRNAVATLPDEHRQVIELRFFADAKLEDIAAALDIPLGTVKSRLHNGLEKLRQLNLAVNLFSTTRESSARQP